MCNAAEIDLDGPDDGNATQDQLALLQDRLEMVLWTSSNSVNRLKRAKKELEAGDEPAGEAGRPSFDSPNDWSRSVPSPPALHTRSTRRCSTSGTTSRS